MKYTSIIEKFNCILEITNNSIIYLIFIIILAILGLLTITKKIKPKTSIILLIIDYIILFTNIIISNTNELAKVFDNIANNFFTNIYFPSIYTYLFILAVIDIATIKGILNKEEKAYKITNGICFFIMQFILVLIMNIISTNNIDIFKKTSLFTNTNLVILLESSINIFLTWLLARTVIYTSGKIIESNNLKTISEPKIINTQLEVSNVDIKEDIEDIKDIKKEYVYSKEETSINDLLFEKHNDITINSDELLDKLLNNGLPIIQEKEIEEERNTYTLNDYKIFNKILREIKETNGSNIIHIDRALEEKLANKYSEEEYNLFKLMLKNYSN